MLALLSAACSHLFAVDASVSLDSGEVQIFEWPTRAEMVAMGGA